MALSQQDKKALTICAGVLTLFMVVQFILLPTLDRKTLLKQRVLAKQTSLKELAVLEKEYVSLSGINRIKTDAASSRARDFTLFSYLDTLAEQSGVKDNVAYMKPSSKSLTDKTYTLSMVKIKLDALYLQELVDFLHGVENLQNNVQIRSISLSKTGKDNNLLDAIVETETLVKGDAA